MQLLPCWACSNNSKGQKLSDFFFASTGQVGAFKEIYNLSANAFRVIHLFQIRAVLLDSWNAKSVNASSDCNNQFIIRYFDLGNLRVLAFACSGQTCALDNLFFRVNAFGSSLEVVGVPIKLLIYEKNKGVWFELNKILAEN